VNFIIKNIESIDKIIINYSDLYTDYDINNIVEKLISINYKTSIITPKFLFKNNNFMIYAINNNMYIDPKMVERFLNFENIRTVNNKEITKKLFEMGYGESYKKTYEKYGLDQFIDIVIKYGDMLKLINYENIFCERIPVGYKTWRTILWNTR
jgi:hypothetical protein